MALPYRFPVSALRPAQGPLSKMVGASALPQIAQLQSSGLDLPRLQELLGEGLVALQDQINALNGLAKLIQQTVTVDGSALPFTPPGGSSGDIQINNGAGGFAGLASTGTGDAVREVGPAIDGPALTGTTTLAGAGGATGLIRSHPTLPIIEFGSLNSSDVTLIVNAIEQIRVLVGGGIKLANLPNANPGAGSKQIFYDPGDGNRVKYAP